MKISAGADISMAVSTTGQAYSWGAAKGGRIGVGMSNGYVNEPRRVSIQDANGEPLKAVDVDCGYVHSLIVALDGTVHQCGGVGTHGDSDGQAGEEGDDSRTGGIDGMWHVPGPLAIRVHRNHRPHFHHPLHCFVGYPRALSDFNIWHRVPEPKEHVKKEKYKKYGKYEVRFFISAGSVAFFRSYALAKQQLTCIHFIFYF